MIVIGKLDLIFTFENSMMYKMISIYIKPIISL